MIISVFSSKTPECSVDFALFGCHKIVFLCGNLFGVAHPTSIFIDPGASGKRIKGFGAFMLLEVGEGSAMCFFFLVLCWASSMTDDTVIAFGAGFVRFSEDRSHHLGLMITDGLYPFVAVDTAILNGLGFSGFGRLHNFRGFNCFRIRLCFWVECHSKGECGEQEE